MKVIYLKRKTNYTLLMFFLLISITSLIANPNLNTNTQNNKDKNSMNFEKFDNLRTSPAAGLYHDDHAESHGYADQYVTWSFSTLPSQIINVWALEAFQYSLWTSGLSASGTLLSTDSSDSGTFNVPEGKTWYIVFWNDESGSQHTIVSYSTNFVGDSRPPSIHVNSPYSSASYRAGTTLETKWSSINAGNNVKIELYKGGVFDMTIVTSTSNDGSYQWTIPEDITPGTNYQVTVSSLSTPAEDLSENFEIRDPNIFTIFFPNSTLSLSMGNGYDIKFDNSEYVEEVNVSLYHNNEFVYYIATQRNNWGHWYQGICPWFIPYDLTPSANYSILICDSENANTNGISEYFEIVEHRGFIIIDPIESTDVQPNSDFTIRWNSTGSIDYVRIELWRDMHYEDGKLISRGIVLTISVNTPNDDSFVWSVPSLPQGSDYFIEIESTTDSGCWRYSDEFYIGPNRSLSNNAILGYDVFILISNIFLISVAIITWYRKRIR